MDKLDELIEQVIGSLEKLARAEETVRKAHSRKAIQLMWEAGHALLCIHAHVGGSKGECIKRLAARLSKNSAWGYESMQLAERFTESQYNRMVSGAIRVSALKALIAIRNKDLRAKMLTESLKHGYSGDEIRHRLGRVRRSTLPDYAVLVDGVATSDGQRFKSPEAANAYIVIEELAGNITGGIVTIVQIVEENILKVGGRFACSA